jgi:hypothetical protein
LNASRESPLNPPAVSLRCFPNSHGASSSSKETQGIRGRVEMFNEDVPVGGYEVLSKPPLGKCSINIKT